MLSNDWMTLHSRMSGSSWVITPSWLSGSWSSFLYSSSVYSCHLFLISSAYIRSTPFLSFIEPIFAWNVPLVSLIFLKRYLVFPILLFSSISLHWSLRKTFLFLLAILWNSAFRCLYLSFSPLLFISLLFTAICKASSDSILRKQRHYFANKGQCSQSYGFSSSHVQMWKLDHKEAPKNWCFWAMVLEKILESPLDCKVIKPVNPKRNQPWLFIGRNDAKAEAPILWPYDAMSQLIGKDPDAGKDWGQEEKGTTKDEVVGWHHRLNEHNKFEQTLGDGEGQGNWCAAVHGVSKSQTRLSGEHQQPQQLW